MHDRARGAPAATGPTDAHPPLPPGPRGVLEVARAFRGFTSAPPGYMLEASRRWGPVASLRLGVERIVFLAEPDLVAEVLLDKEGIFLKDRVTRGLSSFLGQGLLTSEGNLWRRQRKLIAPSLSKKHIATYAKAMVRATRDYADALGDRDVRDVHADMTDLTLDIVVETLFGTGSTSGNDRVGHLMDALMNDFQQIIQTWRRFVPDWVPLAARRRTRRQSKELDAIVLSVVGQRRASGELGDDLLSRLLAARDDEGSGMTDSQLRDEVATLFLAGHETTANSLAFTFALLGDHPEALDRLQREVGQVLGDRAAEADDVPALSFTEAVVKESMRLYPPAHIIGREPTRDVRLGAWHVPKGSAILISPWALHHDARFFEEPDAFRPERWLEASAASLPRYAYMPFGGGPRICVGNHFAMMEAVLVLATLAPRVRFERTGAEPLRLQHTVTLRPQGGIPMRVRRARRGP